MKKKNILKLPAQNDSFPFFIKRQEISGHVFSMKMPICSFITAAHFLAIHPGADLPKFHVS
jgi:hypothetical protein